MHTNTLPLERDGSYLSCHVLDHPGQVVLLHMSVADKHNNAMFKSKLNGHVERFAGFLTGAAKCVYVITCDVKNMDLCPFPRTKSALT